MAERLTDFIGLSEDEPTSSQNVTNEIFEENGMHIPIPNYPLIKMTEFSQAFLDHATLDKTEYAYPDYVNHEHFLMEPRKFGKHAWLVGGQENEVHTIPVNANSFLIGNILVDPGSYEGIPTLIENLGQRGKELSDIALVLVTHAHLDHMAALNDLQMLGLVAPVLVPEKSIEQIKNKDAAKIGMDLYQHGFEDFRIDYALQHNETFSASGFSITAKEGPGHSPDHMYYVMADSEGHQTVAAGDILVGGGRKQFGSDKMIWKETLQVLMSDVKGSEADNFQEYPDDILTGHHFRAFHKTSNLLRDIERFGGQESDIVPSQPGMIMSWW